MSESKHTPGPWAVCSSPPNPQWHLGVTIFSVPEGKRVADACILNAEFKADARLIAAAPDLLMALQAIEHRHSSSPHIGLVRAAIAKATFDGDAPEFAQLLCVKILSCVQHAAVIPHDQIAWRPAMLIGELRLFLMVK